MIKILFAVAAYLLGSIPTGYLVVRAADRRDIRQFGSRSTGATNVLRVKGLKYALPVMAIDVLKGFLPAFLALRLFHDPVLAGIAGFLAVAGHCYPFSIGFKGGKGMATAMGFFAAVSFWPFALTLAVFVLVIAASRFVSLGSILAVVSFPVFQLAFRRPAAIIIFGGAVALLVVARHSANIQRIVAGTERRLGEKSE